MHLIPIALIGAFILSSSVAAPIPTEADQLTPGSSQQVSTTAALSVPQAPGAKAEVRGQEKAKPLYTVSLTAYNAVAAQTDANPGVTASGALSNPEVVAARSHDLAGSLPFGTVIALERTAKDTSRCQYDKVSHLIGYRVIADMTNARFSDRVDIEFPIDTTVSVPGMGSVSAARALGVCDQVTLRVVGKVDVKNIPQTQAELARLIDGTQLARR